jgi:hypothetical protein
MTVVRGFLFEPGGAWVLVYLRLNSKRIPLTTVIRHVVGPAVLEIIGRLGLDSKHNDRRPKWIIFDKYARLRYATMFGMLMNRLKPIRSIV